MIDDDVLLVSSNHTLALLLTNKGSPRGWFSSLSFLVVDLKGTKDEVGSILGRVDGTSKLGPVVSHVDAPRSFRRPAHAVVIVPGQSNPDVERNQGSGKKASHASQDGLLIMEAMEIKLSLLTTREEIPLQLAISDGSTQDQDFPANSKCRILIVWQ